MKKKVGLTHLLFGIYCILLIWLILFKLNFTSDGIKMMFGHRSLNLIPFYYGNEVGTHFSEVVRNLIVFIPFGFYLGMLGVGFAKNVLAGLIFSLVMEICQFVFAIGAWDITDIITNTLGTVIGGAFYLLLTLIFGNRKRLDKLLKILLFAVTVAVVGFILLIVLMTD